MNSRSGDTTNFQDKANDWAQLAQQDPEAFEAMRTELLQNFIQNSPANVQKNSKVCSGKSNTFAAAPTPPHKPSPRFPV